MNLISETGELRKKINDISTLADYHEALIIHKSKGGRESREALSKLELAENEMIRIGLEARAIIKDIKNKKKV